MTARTQRPPTGPAGAPRPPKELVTRDYLKAVPQRNEAMQTESRPRGALLVTVPMRKPAWMVPPLSWILPYSSSRRVELDALGAEVIGLCDGKRSVESIIEAFAQRHRLSFREGQLAVTQFLKLLTARGIVAIVGRSKESPKR